MSDLAQAIKRPVPPREEVRRGRAFARVYMAGLALALAAFVALWVFAARDVASGFDVTVTRAVQSTSLPLYRWLLVHVSDLGFNPLSPLTFIAVFLPLFLLRLRLEAVLAVASALLASLAGGGIKLLVERARPSPALVHVAAHLRDYSFPSGHVIHYTTLFGFACYIVLVAWRSSLPRNLILVILALLILLVGPSRVYLGEHWPTDVLGAYLFAGLWLAGTIELHLRLKPRLKGW